MDDRNFAFMFYGLASVWTILAAYVAYLGAREGKLRRQIDNIRRMLEDQEKPT